MIIRKATALEMLRLWGYSDIATASPTTRYFFENIESGNAVFWTAEEEGNLIGELYVFLNLTDKDFADGKNTAYLCAFRVSEEYRGQGIGTSLIRTALEDLSKRGFHSATIGVEASEEWNAKLYSRLGFNTRIKECNEDPCAMTENMKPNLCSLFLLLQKII